MSSFHSSSSSLKRVPNNGFLTRGRIELFIIILLLSLLAMGVLTVYRLLFITSHPQVIKMSNSNNNIDEYQVGIPLSILSEGHQTINDFYQLLTDDIRQANMIYVIPGGGSNYDSDGNGDSNGYPEWTRQRVQAAYDHYMTLDHTASKPIFLALSAGSLNSPNQLKDNNQIVFECQHIIKHLIELGVPKQLIFGDTFSWDTVGNGLTLRMVVEGLIAIQRRFKINNQSQQRSSNELTYFRSQNQLSEEKIQEHRVLKNRIQLNVFISDFHAERVQKTFEWVLGLKPSLLGTADMDDTMVGMDVYSVSSKGVNWKNKDDFQTRIEHEKRGVSIIERNKENIQTIGEFYGFLMLGVHRGLFNYLHGSYKPSKGAGW